MSIFYSVTIINILYSSFLFSFFIVSLQVVKMLATIVVLFGICWLPIHIFILVLDYNPSLEKEYRRTLTILYIVIHWLAMANSFMNPIIYGFMNDNFRVSRHLTTSGISTSGWGVHCFLFFVFIFLQGEVNHQTYQDFLLIYLRKDKKPTQDRIFNVGNLYPDVILHYRQLFSVDFESKTLWKCI